MNRAAVAVFSLALAAAPLCAQNVDIGIWAVDTSLQGDTVVDEVNDISIGFDEELGFGATADIFWGERFSTELGIYAISADGTMDLGFLDETIELGSLDVTPATLMLRGHFGSDRFDAYVGAGAVFATFESLEREDLGEGVLVLEIDDVFTWGANVGLSVGVSGGFRLGIDAKWIPLEADAIDEAGIDEVTLELDPLLLSAGAIWRF